MSGWARAAGGSAPLPFRGVGISRQVLDEAVLALRGASRGASAARLAVRRIMPALWKPRRKISRPETLLLATGKHETRGLARPASPGTLVGFKTYFRLQPAERDQLSGHVELILFPGGYAGLQPVEGGRANFCLVIEAGVLRRLGGWPEVLAIVQETLPASRRTAARRRGDCAPPAQHRADALRFRAPPRFGRCGELLPAGRPGGGDPVLHRGRHGDRLAQRRSGGALHRRRGGGANSITAALAGQLGGANPPRRMAVSRLFPAVSGRCQFFWRRDVSAVR